MSTISSRLTIQSKLTNSSQSKNSSRLMISTKSKKGKEVECHEGTNIMCIPRSHYQIKCNKECNWAKYEEDNSNKEYYSNKEDNLVFFSIYCCVTYACWNKHFAFLYVCWKNQCQGFVFLLEQTRFFCMFMNKVMLCYKFYAYEQAM